MKTEIRVEEEQDEQEVRDWKKAIEDTKKRIDLWRPPKPPDPPQPQQPAP